MQKKTLSGKEEGKETEEKGGRRDKEYHRFYSHREAFFAYLNIHIIHKYLWIHI